MKLTQCFHLMMDVKRDKAAQVLHWTALQLRLIAAGELGRSLLRINTSDPC